MLNLQETCTWTCYGKNIYNTWQTKEIENNLVIIILIWKRSLCLQLKSEKKCSEFQ